MPNDLSSWVWWIFTTIILAIVVNIVSESLKTQMGTIWGYYSNQRKLKNEEEEKKIRAQIESMRKNSERLSHFYFLFTSVTIDLYAFLFIGLITILTFFYLIPFVLGQVGGDGWKFIVGNKYFFIAVYFIFIFVLGIRIVRIYSHYTYFGKVIKIYEDIILSDEKTQETNRITKEDSVSK